MSHVLAPKFRCYQKYAEKHSYYTSRVVMVDPIYVDKEDQAIIICIFETIGKHPNDDRYTYVALNP